MKQVREIVLDTETTGFDPFKNGDRIVEIGAVELINHIPTGAAYHQYVDPDRDMPEGAFKVHGLSREFLLDFPRFQDVAAGFIDFIGDSPLVIHNAPFDMKFLNAELDWAGFSKMPMKRAIDTLAMAREKFPGAQNTLDALCRRFGVDSSRRVKHGALLDSEILAEVYLELVGGRQVTLSLAPSAAKTSQTRAATKAAPTSRPQPLQPRLTQTEDAAHRAFLRIIGADGAWGAYGVEPGEDPPK